MATKNVKEEIETKAAVEAVEKAEEKVKQIELDKAAKRAAKQEKRANWPGPLKLIGKGFNEVENHPAAFGIGFALGVPVVPLVAYGVKKGIDLASNKKAEEAVDVSSDETDEVDNSIPFEE